MLAFEAQFEADIGIGGIVGTLFWLGTFAFWLWMVISCARSDPERGVWLLIIIFAAPLGALIYFLARWFPSREYHAPRFLHRFTKSAEVKRLETAAHQIGNAYQWIQLGDKLVEVRVFDQAGNAYRKAVEKEGDNLQALWGAALCEIKAKEWDSARPRLEAILAENPDYKFGDVSFARCHLLYETNEKAEARKALEKHTKRWRTPQSHFLLATILEEDGDIEQARTCLQEMLMDINSSPKAIARKQTMWKSKARVALKRLKKLSVR